MEEKKECRRDESGIMMPDLVLSDDFKPGDLDQPDYCAPLAAAVAAIVEQNALLITRAGKLDFDPMSELEYSTNGGNVNIHEFFETLARYEEGRVPKRAIGALQETTMRLLDVLSARPDAPIVEIDRVRVAFGKASIFWLTQLRWPRRVRKAYLKAIVESRMQIGAALEALHEAYVKQSAQGAPAKTHKRRRHMAQPSGRVTAEERQSVLRAIDRLVRNGMSIRAAIHYLHRAAAWKARLGSVSEESWRIYYHRRGA